MLNGRLCIRTAPYSVSLHTTLPSGTPKEFSETCVEAIFFDFCGVLYDDTAWRRWLLQLLSRLGLHTHYTAFYRVWDREYQDDVTWGTVDYWAAMRSFLLAAGLTRGQLDEVEGAGRARFRDFALSVRPYPHVRAALAQLAARGIHLGLACRAPLATEELEASLARLRLGTTFPSVFSTRTLPRSATSEDRLRAVLDATALPAASVAYVGRTREDLAAAKRLGMLTIAFNPEPDAAPDFVLDQYDQLPPLFSKAPPRRAAG